MRGFGTRHRHGISLLSQTVLRRHLHIDRVAAHVEQQQATRAATGHARIAAAIDPNRDCGVGLRSRRCHSNRADRIGDTSGVNCRSAREGWTEGPTAQCKTVQIRVGAKRREGSNTCVAGSLAVGSVGLVAVAGALRQSTHRDCEHARSAGDRHFRHAGAADERIIVGRGHGVNHPTLGDVGPAVCGHVAAESHTRGGYTRSSRRGHSWSSGYTRHRHGISLLIQAVLRGHLHIDRVAAHIERQRSAGTATCHARIAAAIDPNRDCGVGLRSRRCHGD